MANATNPRMVFPQPKLKALYMRSPASGSSPPTIERNTVFAAMVDAAYCVYASMRYCWTVRVN